MRIVKYTSRFKRDYRREKSGRIGKKVDDLLMKVVDMLAADIPLPRRDVDHPLTGDWADHRDCLIRPDLILIYRKPDDDNLELGRPGSHSELVGVGNRNGEKLFAFVPERYPTWLNRDLTTPVINPPKD